MKTAYSNFETIQEFAAHVRGKSWEYLCRAVRGERQNLSMLCDMPRREKLAYPELDRYDLYLSYLERYMETGRLPFEIQIHHEQHKHALEILKEVRTDLEHRGEWKMPSAMSGA